MFLSSVPASIELTLSQLESSLTELRYHGRIEALRSELGLSLLDMLLRLRGELKGLMALFKSSHGSIA